MCFQLFYSIVPIVSIQSWKLLQYLNLSSQLSAIMKVKMWAFLRVSIINGGRTCQLPLRCCEHFVIVMFQIWDLADTDGKGILNKQVWLFTWCITLTITQPWNKMKVEIFGSGKQFFWQIFQTDFSNFDWLCNSHLSESYNKLNSVQLPHQHFSRL